MKTLLLFVFGIALLAWIFIAERHRKRRLGRTTIEWPDRENDKVVGVEGADPARLREVVSQFAQEYDAPDFLGNGTVFETLLDGKSVLRFPRDIPADILLCLVNFLKYPFNGPGFADPQASCTIDSDFVRLGAPQIGSKALIFVSEMGDYDTVRTLFPNDDAWEYSFREGGGWSPIEDETRRYADSWVVNV